MLHTNNKTEFEGNLNLRIAVDDEGFDTIGKIDAKMSDLQRLNMLIRNKEVKLLWTNQISIDLITMINEPIGENEARLVLLKKGYFQRGEFGIAPKSCSGIRELEKSMKSLVMGNKEDKIKY